MKMLVLALLLLWLQPAMAAYNLDCNSNFQPQVGKDTETVAMTSVDPNGFGNRKYTANLRDHTYEVVWHKELDTLYVTIQKGNQRLVFSTSRIPTFDHNDMMVDITLPDGTRRWISCNFKPNP